jgi:hypothetical protein
MRNTWTEEEDTILMSMAETHKCKWRLIQRCLPNRSDDSIRNRWMRNTGQTVLVPAKKRSSEYQKWSKEDDDKLREGVASYGKNWCTIQQEYFEDRNTKSLRGRWNRLQNMKRNRLRNMTMLTEEDAQSELHFFYTIS